MNKKGFTLVELLATIVIIALLSGIATISYNAFIKQSEDAAFKRYQDTMHSEAVAYFLDNPGEVSSVPFDGENNPKRLSLAMLNTKAINNPVDKDDLCPNSYVDVARNDNSSIINISSDNAIWGKCNEWIFKL